MHRYYISAIVGSGTDADPYRPRVADLTDRWPEATLPTIEGGSPKTSWCLVKAVDNLPPHPDITPLPHYPLDMPVSALDATAKARWHSALAGTGVALREMDRHADVILRLGQTLDPDYWLRYG